MNLAVHATDGKAVGRDLDLADDVFGIEPNEHVLYLAVKQYLAAQRHGTHSTREKSQLSGSTRKLKRQKGTGTARAGSIKSPLFRGGATVFGPHPRTYGIKLNKKVKRLARRSALSAKAAAGALKVVEDFDFAAPRTKDARALVEALHGTGRGRTLVVTAAGQANVRKSFGNLQEAKLVTAHSVNVYDLLNAATVVLTEGAARELEGQLSSTAKAATATAQAS